MYITNSHHYQFTSKGVLPIAKSLDEAIENLKAFAKRNGYKFFGEKDGDAYDAVIFKGSASTQYSIEFDG